MHDDTTSIPVAIARSTDLAYLLRNQETEQEDWFPKSQIVWDSLNEMESVGVANIPDWLLDKRGW